MKRSIGFCLLLSAVALGGCLMHHDPEPEPVDFEFTVAIAAVSLAEDCPDEGVSSRYAGDCAPAEPGFADTCGGFCQGSSVSLAITADADRALSFGVRSVTLLDDAGSPLMELSAGDARLYDPSEGYLPWDETIPTPSSELSVLYDLHGIDWSTMEDSYGRTFKLRVVVEVEGQTRTLTSEETTREYPIVT